MKPFFTEADCTLEISSGYSHGLADGSVPHIRVEHPSIKCLSLEQANRLLESRGKVVIGTKLKDSGLVDEHREGWSFHEEKVWPQNSATHTALLINIEPIETEDTPEGLLEELIKDWNRYYESGLRNPEVEARNKLMERAKKLIGKKERCDE